jgi:hypothetical protein
VVTFGSSLNYYTVDGGHMDLKAEVWNVHIFDWAMNPGTRRRLGRGKM